MASYTVIFAFALLLEFTAYSTLALPKGITDQENTDQDRLISMADDGNEEELGLLSFRRYPIIEGRLADEDGTKRIFILAVSVDIVPHVYTFLCYDVLTKEFFDPP